MRILCVLFGLAVLAGPALAATFTTIDTKTVTGELQSVDDKGVMTVKPEKGEPIKIPADNLMRVEFDADREPEELLDGVVVYLPGGDRICGTLAASSQTQIEVQSAALGKVALPLERLAAIEFRRAGEQPKKAEEMRTDLLANKTANDISFSTNGDQMPGILVGFDKDKVVLKTSLGEMPLNFSRLFGVSFASRKLAPPPPSLLAAVRLTDGSVVTGTLAESKGGLALALLAGPTVQIRSDKIIDLGFRQGKLVYLSDLKPAEETYTPYFGGDHTWPYQRDRNYDRKPIRLGDKTFRKGLGTFSGTVLAYTLGGEFTKFAALVGIDDADSNYQGDVTVRVLADGKEVFKKPGITRKAGPASIDISVAGVKKLELAVDFGGNMHFGDITDWANAHLIR